MKFPAKGGAPLGANTDMGAMPAPAIAPAPAASSYVPPPVAAAPATRPMAPDTGKRNALPQHAMHARGRARGTGKY